LTLAIELAKDKSRRLKVAYIQGIAFVTMMANALWALFRWSLAEMLMLVGGVVSLGIYLVGIAYGIRVQRWLRRNSWALNRPALSRAQGHGWRRR
jgi:hypothetical protein